MVWYNERFTAPTNRIFHCPWPTPPWTPPWIWRRCGSCWTQPRRRGWWVLMWREEKVYFHAHSIHVWYIYLHGSYGMVLTDICSKKYELSWYDVQKNQYFQHDVTHVQDVIGHKTLCFTTWVMFARDLCTRWDWDKSHVFQGVEQLSLLSHWDAINIVSSLWGWHVLATNYFMSSTQHACN